MLNQASGSLAGAVNVNVKLLPYSVAETMNGIWNPTS